MREAQDYTWHALQKAYRPGMGQMLPDRLFWAREEEAEPRVEDAAPPQASTFTDTDRKLWSGPLRRARRGPSQACTR